MLSIAQRTISVSDEYGRTRKRVSVRFDARRNRPACGGAADNNHSHQDPPWRFFSRSRWGMRWACESAMTEVRRFCERWFINVTIRCAAHGYLPLCGFACQMPHDETHARVSGLKLRSRFAAWGMRCSGFRHEAGVPARSMTG